MSTTPHTLSSALEAAERIARREFGHRASADQKTILSCEINEAAECWIFYLDEKLLPEKGSSEGMRSTAYAVAKGGNLEMLVYDFRPNKEKMQAYAEAWSLHAVGKKSEANAALESLLKKYPERYL